MAEFATFRFHGTLKDFLHPGSRESSVLLEVSHKQTVKDAIEAIGVPHPEVAAVSVNGEFVTLAFPLPPNCKVEVYSFETKPAVGVSSGITPAPLPLRFVLDVHLGKLARSLRLLGFDTIYRNDFADGTIAQISATENRVVLTRDVGLLKHKIIKWGYWLRSQHPQEQMQEVWKRFHLAGKVAPFTRCMACNGTITEVSKEEVLGQLLPKTKLFFNQFFQCQLCRRVYWKGSHYDRMQEFLNSFEMEK